MNYYRRYVGDYLKKTSRLSILEHGAYNVLLDYYYAEERPLPGDLDEVYRLVRAMMPEERRAVDKVLFTYFEKREGGYHNSRADEEMDLARPAIEAARNNGSRGGRPTRRNPPGYEDETQQDTQRVNGSETHRGVSGLQPPTSNLQPSAVTLEPAIAGSGNPPVSPTACPHGEIIKLYAKHLPMGRQVRPPWNGTRSVHLQARWREDKKRQQLAWWDQFFDHCSKSQFLTGRVQSRPGRKPFEVALDWIIEPSNFQKIIEGAYDD